MVTPSAPLAVVPPLIQLELTVIENEVVTGVSSKHATVAPLVSVQVEPGVSPVTAPASVAAPSLTMDGPDVLVVVRPGPGHPIQ